MGRKDIVIFSFFIILLAAVSYSQADGNRGQRSRVAATPDKPSEAGPGKLVGHCTLLAGGGNLFESPCNGIMLALKDGGGVELMQTRTDKNGEFTFEASEGVDYHVTAWSRFYAVVSPLGVLHAGQRIDLKIKQQ
jgi:hypothetical protein